MPSSSENILFFISCFGILQGIILAAFIYFHPKSDRSINIFLATYIGSIALVMAIPLMSLIIPWQKIFFMEALTFLPGPMMYLYVRSLKETITWRKAFPHLLLFIIYFFFCYWWFAYMGRKYPNEKFIPVENLYSPITICVFVARYSQMLFYYFLARKTLRIYQQSIRHLFSEISRIELNWIKWLVTGYLLIIIVTIVIIGLMVAFPQYFYELFLLNIALVTPYIYAATYMGITQPTIWQKKTDENKQQLEEEMQEAEHIESQVVIVEKSRPAKTTLQPNKIDDIVNNITNLMEAQRLYAETELTLKQLADKLQVPSYQVSQAINEGMKKNFYDLINGYRVEEAKRLLLDPKNENYTILSVGFEAGFNSKTTFNTVFKKFTGVTPTEFRNKDKEITVLA
jgi:AraC-like DNA-binding protein